MESADRFLRYSNIDMNYRSISLRSGQSTGYVTFPILKNLEQGDKYDLIFIDGRYRADCVLTARSVLVPGGYIVVHDTDRSNYIPAIEAAGPFQHFPEFRTSVITSPGHCIRALDDFTGEPLENTSTEDDSSYEILDRLKLMSPFSYVRFREPEIQLMNQDTRMGKELRDSFSIEHPDYLIGAEINGFTQPLTYRCCEGNSFEGVNAIQNMYTDSPAMFKSLLKTFREKKVLFIGGNAVRTNPFVQKAFNVRDSIGLPDEDASEKLNPKMKQIQRNINRFDIAVVAIGSATRILAKRLWMKGYRNKQFLDIGSVTDALAGRRTRDWIQNDNHLKEYRALIKGL
jgi:hypothetical protein